MKCSLTAFFSVGCDFKLSLDKDDTAVNKADKDPDFIEHSVWREKEILHNELTIPVVLKEKSRVHRERRVSKVTMRWSMSAWDGWGWHFCWHLEGKQASLLRRWEEASQSIKESFQSIKETLKRKNNTTWKWTSQVQDRQNPRAILWYFSFLQSTVGSYGRFSVQEWYEPLYKITF